VLGVFPSRSLIYLREGGKVSRKGEDDKYLRGREKGLRVGLRRERLSLHIVVVGKISVEEPVWKTEEGEGKNHLKRSTDFLWAFLKPHS